MHENCQFCHLDYDFYLHLETLKTDMAYIYEQVGCVGVVFFTNGIYILNILKKAEDILEPSSFKCILVQKRKYPLLKID